MFQGLDVGLLTIILLHFKRPDLVWTILIISCFDLQVDEPGFLLADCRFPNNETRPSAACYENYGSEPGDMRSAILCCPLNYYDWSIGTFCSFALLHFGLPFLLSSVLRHWSNGMRFTCCNLSVYKLNFMTMFIFLILLTSTIWSGGLIYSY